ncbi:glycerol kinase GlpK [Alkalimonas sp. MEB108]|uniref:Glycerol kinase GlpK n=1 Tax=Alkalimonas cellulosilytica TaxID=3058395 RepID=A0ABU7J0K4_9GAMM|nr:glycerol kinase GlpK [Alkalimonas sp. MEB108]MEE1999982.1 glycerol kinase GlpK [Alkalimonas sp. MEB108]
MPNYLIALDQGTTSTRAILYNRELNPIASISEELPLSYPQAGWVEQDPEAIWQSVLHCIQQLLQQNDMLPEQIAGLALTNQRETTLLWEKASGKTLYPAIVWQDRRTADECLALKQNDEASIRAKTGLLADPYFSASKLQWLLEQLPEARQRAEAGELCFGTIDSFLLWRLTGGNVHATEASNASRTLLFNIHQLQWDPELLTLFQIPAALLPEVRDSATDFGHCSAGLFGHPIPILSMLGDQQAALLGQACVKPGMLKSTYGTGCFAMVNTGDSPLQSQHQLLTTVAWRIQGKATYAMEGSIFMAGATVQWLRDKLGIIQQASDSETLAEGIDYQQTELLIPAFTGLGAPHWQPKVQAALFGLSRNSGKAEICAAALRSVAYQTQDLLLAMAQDGISIADIRVDGGMTVNHWFLQALADLTQHSISQSKISDATAFGTAFLAARQLGWVSTLDAIQSLWQRAAQFSPQLSPGQQSICYQNWCSAMGRLLADPS